MSDVEVFRDGSIPEETSIAISENTSSMAKTALSGCESTKEDVQIDGHLNDTVVDTHNLHIISLHICLFLSFFQLCYKISEHGISLLLAFIRILLFWLSSFIHSDFILQPRDLIPTSVYFLRKICGTNSMLKHM